jgi:hypothetical protein
MSNFNETIERQVRISALGRMLERMKALAAFERALQAKVASRK